MVTVQLHVTHSIEIELFPHEIDNPDVLRSILQTIDWSEAEIVLRQVTVDGEIVEEETDRAPGLT